jgi:hypothetical protein
VDPIRHELSGRAGRRAGGQCLLALFAFLLSACTKERARATETDIASPVNGPPARLPASPPVDSILPVEEEVRRFRAEVPDVPTRLTGGAISRDALVRRWVKAVEARDSTALRDMLMSAAEYITSFYPESPYTKPPYRQGPAVRWSLMTNASLKGASRVWERHAGQPMGFTRYHCDQTPTDLGRNRIWTNCVAELKTGPIALFGPIIERDGRFKFVTYGSGY